MAGNLTIGTIVALERQTDQTTRLDKLQRQLVQCRKALEERTAQNSKDTQSILKTRADALARKRGDGTPHDTMEVIVFQLAHERYALELSYVGEVKELKELTPLPCTPSFVAGIINLRGQIVSVVDLKQFFDLATAGATNADYVIILHDANMKFGILADAITGVLPIPANAVQAVPKEFKGSGNAYLKGITSDRIALLDAKQLLSDPDIIVNKQESSVAQKYIA